jgi:type IV secretion system protein VirB5
MKKFIVMLLVLSLSYNQTVSASGVPTIDIASIIQGLKDALIRAKEFKQQIKEAKNRLNEMRNSSEHYRDMVDGHFDFESILNDPTLNKYLALDDWKDIYNDTSDLSDLRDEFGMVSNNPTTQKKYDRKLQTYSAQSKFYDMSVKRNDNLKDLLAQFTTATNPAAKADLANSIQFENARIKNDAKMMESMTALMEQTATLEHEQRSLEKIEVIRGGGMAVDYSSAYEDL